MKFLVWQWRNIYAGNLRWMAILLFSATMVYTLDWVTGSGFDEPVAVVSLSGMLAAVYLTFIRLLYFTSKLKLPTLKSTEILLAICSSVVTVVIASSVFYMTELYVQYQSIDLLLLVLTFTTSLVAAAYVAINDVRAVLS